MKRSTVIFLGASGLIIGGVTLDRIFNHQTISPDSIETVTATKVDGLRDVQMVQGRDACIDALVARGKTRTEAITICDDMTPKLSQQTGSNTQSSSAGSSNNVLFWYLIGRDHGSNAATAYAYTGSPTTGFQAARSANTPTAVAFAPPSSLAPTTKKSPYSYQSPAATPRTVAPAPSPSGTVTVTRGGFGATGAGLSSGG